MHQFKIKTELNIFIIQDSDVLIGQDFNIPIINILWQLVAGYRFEKDNKDVNNVTEIFQEGIKIHMIPLFLLKVSTDVTSKNYSQSVLAVSRFNWLREKKGNLKGAEGILHI